MATRAERLRAYKLTEARYDEMLARQGGCGVCRTPTNGRMANFCIDHDHRCCPRRKSSCGACVRGLLCGGCNGTLGFYELALYDCWTPDRLEVCNRYLTERRVPGLAALIPGCAGSPCPPSPDGPDRSQVYVEYYPAWLADNATNILSTIEAQRSFVDPHDPQQADRLDRLDRRAISLTQFLQTGQMSAGGWHLVGTS